jgi:replicative DNA helicase
VACSAAVYVFGGRPGQGKSTAALNVAMHAAAESSKQSLVISKEMPSVDVTGRILAAGAQVPLQEINARKLTDTSMARIREYVKRVGRPPITVDARPRTLAGIKTLARAHHHRSGLDVLVVDYLQLVRTDTPSRSREQEVAEVSRQLKELDCVVVLPAQLNRESAKRTDPRPNMSDLRDSGQIEQDADAVILLHRERNEKGEPTGQILFIVDKNRHGPTAEVSLRWHGGYGAIG